jgi:tetratricopeptide (TPR) repeat protein
MRSCVIAVLLLCVVSGACAGSAAERAAAAGDYQLAAQSYEQELTRSGFSAPVLFNLGNAWLRLGKPARAILEYERALVLAPRDPAIKANLAAAQQRLGIAPTEVSPWLAAARYFTFDTVVYTGVAALWALCAAVVLLLLGAAARRFARPLILASALALCASADATVLCWSDLYRAVAQGSASLQLAPAASAASSGAVREGEVLWIQDRYAGFNLVRTADGHTGWISDQVAVPVRISRP